MATFSQLVASNKRKGKGRIGSITKAMAQKTGQNLDPRNALVDPKGLMAALFPSLKGYNPRVYEKKYKDTGESGVNRNLDRLSQGIDKLNATNATIVSNTSYIKEVNDTVKSINRNIISLLKVNRKSKFIDAENKENALESAYNQEETNLTPEKIEPPKEEEGGIFGLISKMLIGGAVIGGITKYFTDPEFKAKINGMVDSFGENVFGKEQWETIKTNVKTGFDGIVKEAKTIFNNGVDVMLKEAKAIWDKHWLEISGGILALGAILNPMGALNLGLNALGKGISGLLFLFNNPLFLSALAGVGVTVAASKGIVDTTKAVVAAIDGKTTPEQDDLLNNMKNGVVPETGLESDDKPTVKSKEDLDKENERIKNTKKTLDTVEKVKEAANTTATENDPTADLSWLKEKLAIPATENIPGLLPDIEAPTPALTPVPVKERSARDVADAAMNGAYKQHQQMHNDPVAIQDTIKKLEDRLSQNNLSDAARKGIQQDIDVHKANLSKIPTTPTAATKQSLADYDGGVAKFASLDPIDPNVAKTAGLSPVSVPAEAGKEKGESNVSPVTVGKDVKDSKGAVSFFESKGWDKIHASAIVGNLLQESGLDTTAFNKKENAQGIAQWRGDRLKKFEEMYKKSVLKSTLSEQLEYVDWELKNKESKAGNKLRATKTIEDATYAVDHFYERSSGADLKKRLQNAQGLLGGSNREAVAKGAIPPGALDKTNAGTPIASKSNLTQIPLASTESPEPVKASKGETPNLFSGMDTFMANLKGMGIDTTKIQAKINEITSSDNPMKALQSAILNKGSIDMADAKNNKANQSINNIVQNLGKKESSKQIQQSQTSKEVMDVDIAQLIMNIA